MKYVLEFGVRGGEHSGERIISSKNLAAELASSLVRIFENEKGQCSAKKIWMLESNCPRMTWSSSTHFVALSKLDGVPRGSATASLWRK